MTGPEHYEQAEQLVRAVTTVEMHPQLAELLIARAQVHATLALAAATAELDADEGPGGGSATGRTAKASYRWAKVLGTEATPADNPVQRGVTG